MKPDLKWIKQYCFKNKNPEMVWVLQYVEELIEYSERLEKVVKESTRHVKAQHAANCDYWGRDNYKCTCGKDNLRKALQELEREG